MHPSFIFSPQPSGTKLSSCVDIYVSAKAQEFGAHSEDSLYSEFLFLARVTCVDPCGTALQNPLTARPRRRICYFFVDSSAHFPWEIFLKKSCFRASGRQMLSLTTSQSVIRMPAVQPSEKVPAFLLGCTSPLQKSHSARLRHRFFCRLFLHLLESVAEYGKIKIWICSSAYCLRWKTAMCLF